MPNKRNGYNPPTLKDGRVGFVPVACGQCMECRKAKASEWRVRLHEEIKTQPYAYFVTLTFAPEKLQQLLTTYNIEECNAVAGKAIRLFLERIRKDTKRSIKHWLITEMGQTESERIHLHGILFPTQEITKEWIEKYWTYGICDIGQYCNTRTINYIVKYVTKIDSTHKGYIPQIFCSKGIGATYIKDFAKQKHTYRPNNTRDYYTLPNGQRVALPIYYRNKVYTEEEREKLWIEKIEQDKRYVNGVEIDDVNTTDEGRHRYYNILHGAQKLNTELGYGDDSKEWQQKEYNVTLNMLRRRGG